MIIDFGSAASGIEAASVAWGPLGWKAAWFSEIEPFPCAVLAYHYPKIQNHGDMTGLADKVRMGIVSAPAVFCAGTPCQAFSVAGKRESLDDERGNLTLTFCEIGDAIDDIRLARNDQPCVLFWENVPGVLNTDDNAFGCFLGKIAGEGEALVHPDGKWPDAGFVIGPRRTIAWRVLDAQYFGLAQRRERVFVVASAIEGFDPAAVLFEFDGVRRDLAPGREPGQNAAADAGCGFEVSGTLDSRTDGGGFPGSNGAYTGHVIPVVGTLRSTDGGADVDHAMAEHLVVSTLDASYGRLQGASGQDMNHGHSHLVPVAFGQNRTSGPVDVGQIRAHGSSHNDFESETFVVQPIPFDTTQITNPNCRSNPQPGAPCHTLAAGAHPPAVVIHGTQDPLVNDDIAFPLGRNSGQENAIAYPLDLRNALRDPEKHDEQNRQGAGIGEDGDPCGTLTKAHVPGVAATFLPAHYTRGKGGGALADLMPTLTVEADRGDKDNCVVTTTMQVRRLMPIECERLQGFPDNYTKIPTWTGWRDMDDDETPESCLEVGLEIRQTKKTKRWRVKDVDGPRYKALGNSWAVPCVRWIGERIHIMLEVLNERHRAAANR